jgi:RNA-directed DNA polymerase
VAEAIVRRKTRVLDFDLRAYFDNVRHDRLLEKVAQRVDDADVMHLLKVILKASGKMGVPQGGVISPLLSNLYLNEVDRMLERAREVTRNGKYTYIGYARFADDLVILIDAYRRHDWLIGAVKGRNSTNCGLKSMMKRAGWSTLNGVKASGFSTSAISAVYAECCGRITRPSSKSGRC